MSIVVPAELLTERVPVITREAILADLHAAIQAIRHRDRVYETPRGRWSGRLRSQLPPPACPPALVRAAVPPSLDEGQALVLDLAVDIAIHGRWQLWGEGWQLRAVGANRCTRDDDCAWCVWRRDPRPETLPAFRVWSNPFLPEGIS